MKHQEAYVLEEVQEIRDGFALAFGKGRVV